MQSTDKKEQKVIETSEDLIDYLKVKFKDKNITSDDIEDLDYDLPDMMKKKDFDHHFFIDSLDRLIGKEKNIDDLIESLNSEKIIDKAFGIETKNGVSTKGENIKQQLKEIRSEALLFNDMQSVKDIDWILQTLQEENLYEIDPLVVNNEGINTEENKEGVNYMIQYSKIGNELQKKKDFQVVRSGAHKNTYASGIKIPLKSNFKNSKAKVLLNDIDLTERKEKKQSDNPNQDLLLRNVVENRKIDLKGKRRISTAPTFFSLSPELSTQILTIMSRIEYPDFDIFKLDSLTNTKASLIVATEIVDRLDIVKGQIIDFKVLSNFLQAVIENYSREKAYYHNDLHAADVMQTLFTIFVKGNVTLKMKLDELSKFSILLAAICHDLKHTGQNNMFHINTKSKIAIRYNDISVLENYHASSLFKLAKDEKLNIFKSFKPEEYRIMRRRIIEAILSTDMANHHNVVGQIKTKIERYQIKQGIGFTRMFDETDNNLLFNTQQTVLNMCLHTSDISNPAKPNKISNIWTDKVYEEFFRQGDLEREKGMPISAMCDRHTTNVNKAMIGFINFVVLPTVDILLNIIPEIPEYGINVRANLKKYQSEYDKDQAAEKLKRKK